MVAFRGVGGLEQFVRLQQTGGSSFESDKNQLMKQTKGICVWRGFLLMEFIVMLYYTYGDLDRQEINGLGKLQKLYVVNAMLMGETASLSGAQHT